jgi:hypothetical protein
MKSFFLFIVFVASSVLNAQDLLSTIPEMGGKDFDKVADVAQYHGSDWKNVVGITHNISLYEAFKIAKENPEITYFFYMKDNMLLQDANSNDFRFLKSGDAVFFTGKPWWGSAPGYADGYVKKTILN